VHALFGLLRATPIIMLSLGCQVQVPSVYADLEQRDLPRMGTAIAVAMTTCVAIYSVVALSGLSIAASHSASVPGNVLDLFAPDDTLGLAMRATMSVAVTLVYPMLCLPCRSTLDHLIFGGEASFAGSAWRHSVETVAVVCSTLVLSNVESNLATVFGFTGATAGAIICYVLPLLFYLRLRDQQPDAVKAGSKASAGFCYLALCCVIPLVVLSWEAL